MHPWRALKIRFIAFFDRQRCLRFHVSIEHTVARASSPSPSLVKTQPLECNHKQAELLKKRHLLGEANRRQRERERERGTEMNISPADEALENSKT